MKIVNKDRYGYLAVGCLRSRCTRRAIYELKVGNSAYDISKLKNGIR